MLLMLSSVRVMTTPSFLIPSKTLNASFGRHSNQIRIWLESEVNVISTH